MIAVSERTKRDLSSCTASPDAKITVTPHGVDPAFGPGAEGGRDYLLYVGAIQARKNPLAAARGGAPRSACRSSSPGPSASRRSPASSSGCGADLRGYVEKDELAQLYRGAAALVLPSRYEGFGLPVLEAMACGTPVVAASDPALREVAGDAARLRRAGRARGRRSGGRSPSATGWSRPGLERARRVHAGTRPRGARSTSTARCLA